VKTTFLKIMIWCVSAFYTRRKTLKKISKIMATPRFLKRYKQKKRTKAVIATSKTQKVNDASLMSARWWNKSKRKQIKKCFSQLRCTALGLAEARRLP
jgi:hypothetical protein